MIERPSLRDANELRAGEDGDMEGQGVVRQLEPPRDVAGRHAVWPALHEQAKDIEAAFLRERAQRANSVRYFHVSRHMEIMRRSQRAFAGSSAIRWPGEGDLQTGAPHSPLGIGAATGL